MIYKDPYRNWQRLVFRTNGHKSLTGHYIYPTYRAATQDLFKAMDCAILEKADIDTNRIKNVVFRNKYPGITPQLVFPVIKQEILRKNPNFGFDVSQDFKTPDNKIFILKIKDATQFGLVNLPRGVPPKLYIKMVRPEDFKPPLLLSWHGCQNDENGGFCPPPQVQLPGRKNFRRDETGKVV